MQPHFVNYKFLFCLAVLFLSVFPLYSQNLVEVSGKVAIPKNGAIPPDGLDVVLLKFGLDENGGIQPLGPVGRIKTDSAGNFKFESLNLDSRSAYQLGSRYEGNLVSSTYFFVKPEDRQVAMDIIVPEITFETTELQISNVALVIEPGVGLIKVTEVHEITNPTNNIIDSSQAPLKISLPDGHSDFSMMNDSNELQYRTENNTLSIQRQFRPNVATIIFAYHLSTPFGQFELKRSLGKNLKSGRVLAPLNQLTINSLQIEKTGNEFLGEAEFETWQFKNFQDDELILKISDIPIKHITYIILGIAVLITLFALLIVFYQSKLRRLET